MHAAHSCGNKLCWAGEHLRWATGSENALDKWPQGRMPHGEAHHKARLTEEKVRSIRERFAAGSITKADLAREHGVTPQSIGAVIARTTWTHV